MIWTPETIAELRDLWNAGWSCAKIGQHFGCTKNSIVGKAHRTPGCDARPSPIKRDGKSAGWVSDRRRPVALPPLPSQARPVVVQVPVEPQPPRPAAPATVRKLVGACLYIVGDRPDWLACGDPTEPGRQYCAAHCAVCFVRRAA